MNSNPNSRFPPGSWGEPPIPEAEYAKTSDQGGQTKNLRLAGFCWMCAPRTNIDGSVFWMLYGSILRNASHSYVRYPMRTVTE